MSKWKLPTPVNVAQEAAIEEKFGDKSKCSRRVMSGTSLFVGGIMSRILF
jgi:hypothetical protein